MTIDTELLKLGEFGLSGMDAGDLFHGGADAPSEPSRTSQCLHSKLNLFFFFTTFSSHGRCRKVLSLVLLTFVFISMTEGTHVALAAKKLFSESSSEEQSLVVADSTSTAVVKRFRNVRINPGVLNAQADASTEQNGSSNAVELNLFDDANLTVVRTGTEKSADGSSESWIGRIEGMTVGQAVLTVNGEAIAGTVNTDDGRLFEIRSAGKGLHVIRELNPDAFPEHRVNHQGQDLVHKRGCGMRCRNGDLFRNPDDGLGSRRWQVVDPNLEERRIWPLEQSRKLYGCRTGCGVDSDSSLRQYL